MAAENDRWRLTVKVEILLTLCLDRKYAKPRQLQNNLKLEGIGVDLSELSIILRELKEADLIRNFWHFYSLSKKGKALMRYVLKNFDDIYEIAMREGFDAYQTH